MSSNVILSHLNYFFLYVILQTQLRSNCPPLESSVKELIINNHQIKEENKKHYRHPTYFFFSVLTNVFFFYYASNKRTYLIFLFLLYFVPIIQFIILSLNEKQCKIFSAFFYI